MIRNQRGAVDTIIIIIAAVLLSGFGGWFTATKVDIGKSGEMRLIELAEAGHEAAIQAVDLNVLITPQDRQAIIDCDARYQAQMAAMKAAWRKWDAEGKEYKGAFLDARKAFRAEQKAFVGLLVPYGIDVINQI